MLEWAHKGTVRTLGFYSGDNGKPSESKWDSEK